jgi:hypothetical protein
MAVGTVRGLAVIHIVVGMHWLLRANHAAGQLNRAIGNHLVRVHVGLRARTCLKHDQRKLTVPTAVNHLLGGTHDQIDFFLRKLAQFPVGQGRTFLQDAERPDDRATPAETLDPDGEVEVRPLGLGPPQMIGRNLHVS